MTAGGKGTAVVQIVADKGGSLDAWMPRGACRWLYPTDLFNELPRDATLRQHERLAEAQAVCGTCPVIAECLAWGIENKASGVFGGMSLNQGKPKTAKGVAEARKRAVARRKRTAA